MKSNPHREAPHMREVKREREQQHTKQPPVHPHRRGTLSALLGLNGTHRETP